MDTVYIMRRTYLTVILSVVFCACAFCREAPGKNRIRMAFYNTENMFDTLASKAYDDAEFTPSGKNAWDGRKYRTKIKNTARVLADMNADIIGLAEIENDGVLADLVGSLPAGYGYVHMETADNRGIDPALLYKKEVFSPVSWTLEVSPMNERGILHVKGVLKTTGDTLHVMVNHWTSRYMGQKATEASRVDMGRLSAETANAILSSNPHALIFACGDLNDDPYDVSVQTLLRLSPQMRSHSDAAKTPGYYYQKQWYSFDQIFTNFAPEGSMMSVFRRPYMLTDGGVPLRTFQGPVYKGGYSDHLPVFIDVEISDLKQ